MGLLYFSSPSRLNRKFANNGTKIAKYREDLGWSWRPLQIREYALREFGEILVDDRPFYRDSCCKEADVQPKGVFSYAMTMIDKISEWEDEEGWVGSMFAACMWIYTGC